MVFPVIMFPAAILFALTELIIPELARCAAAGSNQRIHYLVHKSLRTVLVYGVTLAGLLFLLSDSLCLALYHNTEAAVYMRNYALLIPMLYCDIITDAMTKGLGQQTVCVRYNIFTSFLDVLFLYFLLPRYGMDGYFFSFLLTHLVNFILSFRQLLKITIGSIPLYVPIAALFSMFFGLWATNHISYTLFRSIGYFLILGSLLVLTRVIRGEDIRWLRGLIYKK